MTVCVCLCVRLCDAVRVRVHHTCDGCARMRHSYAREDAYMYLCMCVPMTVCLCVYVTVYVCM